MRYILKRKTRKSGGYIYTVENDEGAILSKRTSDREYEACLIYESNKKALHYFGRIDLVGKGYSAYTIENCNIKGIPYSIVYNKEAIEKLVIAAYNTGGTHSAIEEADKHATITTKYCSQCDNYHPAFKDEDFCLICGYTHTKRKDPDLLIPLENKE